jgi:DNA replication regulator SLD3.
LQDLIDFLRSLIINTVLIDKKYRETIPEIVARIKTLVDDSEKGSRPKKRKRKKPKLGKDGLYPGEIEHIKKWWTALQPQQRGVDDDDDKIMSATETKFHISCLRRRETQLQIILILEILALEAQTQPPQQKDSSNEVQQQGGEPQAVDRENSQEPPAKKRNKHNLPVLLDVHADRLCIWQTTALDEVKALAETQAIADGEGAEKPKSAHSDPLRDFCVDIIIPL